VKVHKIQLMFQATMIRLLIIGDQPCVCKGLRMRFAAESDFSVVAEAADGPAALALTTALQPDVVLMDVEMRRTDVNAMARVLRSACPHASVVMLSFHDDDRSRQMAKQAGVAALVSKSMPADALVIAIRKVVQ
jgi:DNA-binding NarL/FixJ family response regulator